MWRCRCSMCKEENREIKKHHHTEYKRENLEAFAMPQDWVQLIRNEEKTSLDVHFSVCFVIQWWFFCVCSYGRIHDNISSMHYSGQTVHDFVVCSYHGFIFALSLLYRLLSVCIAYVSYHPIITIYLYCLCTRQLVFIYYVVLYLLLLTYHHILCAHIHIHSLRFTIYNSLSLSLCKNSSAR